MIEVLVVIAIIALIAALGLYMSISTLHGTFRRSEAATIVSLLQSARSRALANIDQSKWGVCYDDPNYEIFKGSICGANIADSIGANQQVAKESNFSKTNPYVVFSQLGATTTNTSDIVVVEEDGRKTTISLNYEGTISWK
jgi:Tfp pilus assembly protein FimT